jgi:ribosomal protein L37AE/L43A
MTRTTNRSGDAGKFGPSVGAQLSHLYDVGYNPDMAGLINTACPGLIVWRGGMVIVTLQSSPYDGGQR